MFCRYCLTNSNEYGGYYFISDGQDEYKRKVQEIFNIQIFDLKSIDKKICAKCVEAITAAANVKKTFMEVQEKLMKHKDLKILVEKLLVEVEQVKAQNVNPKMKKANTHKIAKQTNLLMRKEKNKFSKHAEMAFVRDLHIDGPSSYTDALKQMKINTLKLIENSNMCLFISKKTKYRCYTCEDCFVDVQKLREHSRSHASSNRFKQILLHKRGSTFLNVDISNLICTNCSKPCHDLDELRRHLESIHRETFDGTEHMLVPFKLENGYECVICQQKYLSFVRLFVHMNSHSSRNVCDKCGVSFTNKISLRCHLSYVHRKKTCPECPAVFSTVFSKYKHIELVHNGAVGKGAFGNARKCNQCHMSFQYHYRLKMHMIETHGAKPPECKVCKFCTRAFPSRLTLMIHTKAVHLNERSHKCAICEKRFFTSYGRRRHEGSHSDRKEFSCRLCDVKFKSLDSSRRHLKRQHGDSKVVGAIDNVK